MFADINKGSCVVQFLLALPMIELGPCAQHILVAPVCVVCPQTSLSSANISCAFGFVGDVGATLHSQCKNPPDVPVHLLKSVSNTVRCDMHRTLTHLVWSFELFTGFLWRLQFVSGSI